MHAQQQPGIQLNHRRDFFAFLKERWGTLFGARYEVLLYDLTSTYFESDAPFAGKRQFGYSRDKRSDCVQVVIALIVTPDGFPVAYEVMPGNTSDKTTLLDFVRKIEAQYGRSERVWVMDRGIPTEETLEAMRADPSGVRYLVGTPKGRLSKLEQSFLNRPWQSVRDSLQVKLHQQEGGEEVYILVRSEGRILKERSMRRRRLKKLWKRLHELQQQSNSRDQLQRKLGAAQQEAGRAWHLVEIEVAPEDGQQPGSFTFHLRREKLRQTMRREGRYLLRSNLTDTDPAELWKQYMQLSEVEQAFKELKHSLSIRPIYHQTEQRIEAHIFLSFIAYCLHVTLKNLAKRQALSSFGAHPSGDPGEVCLDATGGRASANLRWTMFGDVSVYTTQSGSSAIAVSTGSDITRSTATSVSDRISLGSQK